MIATPRFVALVAPLLLTLRTPTLAATAFRVSLPLDRLGVNDNAPILGVIVPLATRINRRRLH